MVFGVDNFNYGHVFNSEAPLTEPTTVVYGGYTIKHELDNFEYHPTWMNVPKMSYDLKTTVVGTDFENIIRQPKTYISVETIEEQMKTAELKAQNYIDGITNDSVSRTNSNGNNGGNNSGNNGGTTIKGCMDETATNYDETATEDDGSCEYESDNTLIYLGLGAGALLIFMGLR